MKNKMNDETKTAVLAAISHLRNAVTIHPHNPELAMHVVKLADNVLCDLMFGEHIYTDADEKEEK